MDPILKEHRKQLGDYEIIDIVDQTAIAHLRDRTKVDAPVTVHWNWDYGSEMEELRRLYEKGKAGQWNAETDIDWSTPISKDEWILNPEGSMLAQLCKLMGKSEATQQEAAFDELNHTLSQLLHGEQAALQLCGQLTNVCEEMDQKFYAASQVIDEARHIEVLAKFLSRKLGTIYPISGTLKVLLDKLLEAEGMQKKVLGMQTLFEGMAVGIMDMIRTESRSPLLTDILARVEGDEARHAAFGVLNMRRIVREASRDEMDEMEDWAFGILEALNANQQLDMLHTFAPKYGYDAEQAVVGFLQMDDFVPINSMPYMHTVVPNLLRLGLITDRTRDRWAKVGMLNEKSVKATLPIAS